MINPSDYVLYFPSIEFQSDNWVKSSLLYWDKIYRIVPENYEPNDSELILEAKEKDLIRNIVLDEKEIRATGDMFLEFTKHLEFLPAGLEAGSDYHSVHADKIDSRLYPSLHELGNIYNKDGWLNFPTELARGYMFYLATVVAKNRGGFSMSTDNLDSWVMSSFFTENGNFNEYTYDRNAEGYYSSLIIDGFIPADLSNVSIDSIVNFCDDEKEQKNKFRNQISNFATSLSKCKNSDTVGELIEDYNLEIKNAKSDLKGSMSFISKLKPCFYTSLIAGIPLAKSAFDYIAGCTQDQFDYNLIGESFAITAVACYKDYSQAKTHRKQNTFASYLIDIDKKFTRANNQMTRFGYSFNEFIND